MIKGKPQLGMLSLENLGLQVNDFKPIYTALKSLCLSDVSLRKKLIRDTLREISLLQQESQQSRRITYYFSTNDKTRLGSMLSKRHR